MLCNRQARFQVKLKRIRCLVGCITCPGNDADGFSLRKVNGCILLTEIAPRRCGTIWRGRRQPECALAQIYLVVAPVEGTLHEGGHGGIRQVDLLVLRWAAASLIGVEVAQLCQQLANGVLSEVELDLERLVYTCQHQFPAPIAGQASGLHVNLQLDLHGPENYTISRLVFQALGAWQL